MERTHSNFLKTHIGPSLHHAYVLEGERKEIEAALTEFLQSFFTISFKNNPDVFHTETETLKIDQARRIKEFQTKKSTQKKGKKIIIISADTITREAQNSLLKVLEEPTQNTHFFIVTPSSSRLLDTLRSRVLHISFFQEKTNSDEKEGEKFLALSLAERLSFVAPLIKKKDKERASSLMEGIEKALHKKLVSSGEEMREKISTEDIQRFLVSQKYVTDQSSSLKLLLENICVTLPTRKRK